MIFLKLSRDNLMKQLKNVSIHDNKKDNENNNVDNNNKKSRQKFSYIPSIDAFLQTLRYMMRDIEKQNKQINNNIVGQKYLLNYCNNNINDNFDGMDQVMNIPITSDMLITNPSQQRFNDDNINNNDNTTVQNIDYNNAKFKHG